MKNLTNEFQSLQQSLTMKKESYQNEKSEKSTKFKDIISDALNL